MHAKMKNIIKELGAMNPALSAAELERIVSDLAARKPIVKPERRFKKELKEKIFGRKRILRYLLRPPVIGVAAAAAVVLVIGVFLFAQFGKTPGRTSSMTLNEYSAITEGAESPVDKSETSNAEAGDVTKENDFSGTGFTPSGPAGVDGRVSPVYKDSTSETDRYFSSNQSLLPSKPKEMKIYFGFLLLTVKEPDKTRDQIAAFAEKLGGYVETASEALVVVRVPKAAFAAALAEISGYGEVTDKSIETYDVTAAYQDLGLRLKVATAARDRLYQLLEKTTDVKERFTILNEIQRLTEQIEGIGRQISGLDRLAAFSKISVTLKPRVQASGAESGAIPFAWIADALSLKTQGKTLRGSVRLDLPADFALLEKEKYTYTENPFGVSLAVYTEENSPRGDGNFWREAVAFHLEQRFAAATKSDLGRFKTVLFQSNDADPFYLLIGVQADGDRLTVCKAVFPNKAQYTAQKTAVEKMIAGIEVRP